MGRKRIQGKEKRMKIVEGERGSGDVGVFIRGGRRAGQGSFFYSIKNFFFSIHTIKNLILTKTCSEKATN